MNKEMIMKSLFRSLVLGLVLALSLPAGAMVSSSTSRIDYTASGSTTVYSFTFAALDKSHVQVQLGGAIQVGGYTVVLNANQATNPGGTVTFVTAPIASTAVRIQRVVPATQGLKLTPYTAFPATSVESALDRLTMVTQQLDRDRNDLASGVGLGTTTPDSVQVTAAGSSTPRPLGQRAADVVNGADDGIIADGVTDEYLALQRFLDRVISTRKAGVLPAGTIRITQTVQWTRPVGLTIRGAGKWATTIYWDGAAGGTALRLYNARQSTLADLYVKGQAGAKKPAILIEIQGDSTDPGLVYAPTQCSFKNMQVGGSAAASSVYGVAYTLKGGSNDQNNDQGHFDTVDFVNVDEGFYNQHVNGKLHSFTGCSFLYGSSGIHIAEGSFQVSGGANYFGGFTDSAIKIDAMSDAITIQGANGEVLERFLNYTTGHGDNGWPLNVIGNRIYLAPTTTSREMIVYKDAGPLRVEGNFFSHANAGALPPYLLLSANSTSSRISVVDNKWDKPGAADYPPLSLVASATKWNITQKGNQYRSSGGTQTVSTDGLYNHTGIGLTVGEFMNGWTILSNRSGGGSQIFTLPANVAAGYTVTIKDTSGSAGTYPSSIAGFSGNVDGLATQYLRTNYGSLVLTYDGTNWWSSGSVRYVSASSADRGDASQTLVAGVDASVQRWATTLTSNRTVTLSTTGATNGDAFRIVRTGLGAFTLDVGGLKTIPNSTAAFVDVTYDGTAWRLTGYGAL
jgi:hypothetical protein